jgi:hypothetical protein
MRGELLQAEAVPSASFVHRQQPTGNRRHHFRLAAHNPAGRLGRRKRLKGQRLAERADHLVRTELLIF